MAVVTCSLCGAAVKTAKPVAVGTFMKCPDCGDEFEVLYDKDAAGDDDDTVSWTDKKHGKSAKDDDDDEK